MLCCDRPTENAGVAFMAGGIDAGHCTDPE
jgi:hypothetical protein